jgi:hypothetical protein
VNLRKALLAEHGRHRERKSRRTALYYSARMTLLVLSGANRLE